AFQEAIQLRRQLMRESPYYRSNLAQSLLSLGRLERSASRHREACAAHGEAGQLYREVAKASGASSEHLEWLADALTGEGAALAAAGQPAAGRVPLREAGQIWEKLRQANPKNAVLKAKQATTKRALDRLLRQAPSSEAGP